ncbi:MAG: peptidase M3 [Sphingomonas sp.]|nr:MAG: peptidase M3 [Sphingomonas sp.]
MRLQLLAFAAILGAVPVEAAPDGASKAVDAFVATPALTPASAAEAKASCDSYLDRAAALQAALEKQPGTALTLRRYDELMLVLNAALFDASIVDQTGATAELRDAGRACQAAVGNRQTAISLSRPIYDRLKAAPVPGDPVARRILTRTLEGYERAGVAGDAAARARITALQEKITADGLTFDSNIANGRKTITAKPAELAGLPADFIKARPPGADGLVTISTDYPDVGPVMNYAKSDDLRRRLLITNNNRAPENDAVLTSLLNGRDALAHELGRPDYAALILEDKMLDTPAKVRAMLDDVATAATGASDRDFARMLARLQKTDPSVQALTPWRTAYARTLIRAEDYAVDPQEVRRYFAYDNVQKGIFRLTEDLFGVQIRPWATKLWSPDAQAFEIVEKGEVIGRFYLDTHPRPGKYNHANVVPIRFGLTGRALPVAALVTNFPSGGHDTGLMEHRDVETFLHEFGHLLHVMFSGRQDWHQANMANLEWDFIEAPSQMLENWVWDYDTLKLFAVDADGKVIPKELVEKMNRARFFGDALSARSGLGLSNVSLSYHSGSAPADLTAAYRTAWDRYAIPPMMDGISPQNSFGHLNGYSAIYYTYTWSKIIATDLFSLFQAQGLRDPATAARYRQQVLAPGGSKPAAELVQDFLGRPLSLEAYRKQLEQGSTPGS